MIVRGGVCFSDHAQMRMKQRGISESAVRAVIRKGQKTVHWQKGERRFRIQVPRTYVEDVTNPDSLDLLHLIVVLSSDENFVITVLREGEADNSTTNRCNCVGEPLTVTIKEFIGREIFAQLSQIFENQWGKWA